VARPLLKQSYRTKQQDGKMEILSNKKAALPESAQTLTSSFRELLRDRFAALKQKNANFSLRAFARYLDVDQSFLSKVLKGEKKFSLEIMAKLSERLGLSPAQTQLLLNSSSFQTLEEDQFRFIADWSHFAILELAKTKKFKADPKDIAGRLQLHVEEVRASLARLEKFGFIAKTENGIKLLRPHNTWSNNEKTSEARRQLQKQYVEKSLKALDEVDFADRDHGSLSIAISKKRLPAFKKRLQEIRQALAKEFQTDEDLDEVYQLTTSLFPLTTQTKTKSKK
jgi:transcriptional regulator with XRE-family HTH domain